MSSKFSLRVPCPNAIISADGQLAAFISGTRLTLKDYRTLKDVAVYACIDRIENAQFSPDGTLILCSIKSRSVVQIFSVEDITWKGRIDEACVGFKSAVFCPDSRHILIESDYGIHISIWSLLDASSVLIMHQKCVAHSSGSQLKIYAFSPDKKYLAVIHKVELVDQIGIYNTQTWTKAGQFKSASQDCIAIDFSPLNSNHIITCDSPFAFTVTIYNIAGEVLSTIKPYINALGFRNICFQSGLPTTSYIQAITDRNSTALSSSISRDLDESSGTMDAFDFSHLLQETKRVEKAAFFALGSYDDKVRIVSLASWQIVFVFHLTHPKDMEIAFTSVLQDSHVTASSFASSLAPSSDSDSKSLKGGKEDINRVITTDHAELLMVESFENDEDSHKTKSSLDVDKITIHQHMAVKNLPKAAASTAASAGSARALIGGQGIPACGCSWSAICPRGVYLAARSDTHPRCLWIFNIKTAKLVTVIVQLEVISQAAWANSSESSILAFIGILSHKIYFWSDSFRLDTSKDAPSELHVYKLCASIIEETAESEARADEVRPLAPTPIISSNLSPTQLNVISEIKWNCSYPMKRIAESSVFVSKHQLMLIGRDGCCEMDLHFEH
jgi:hypothetical protein